jgi:hypothetical protein
MKSSKRYRVIAKGDENEGLTLEADELLNPVESGVFLKVEFNITPVFYLYSEVELEEDEEEVAPILPSDAALRKCIPVYTGFIKYFPDAIAAISYHSYTGGVQHGQTLDTLHWDRSKSTDHLDALMRHVLEEDWEAVAWRALAHLQTEIEKEKQQ